MKKLISSFVLCLSTLLGFSAGYPGQGPIIYYPPGGGGIDSNFVYSMILNYSASPTSGVTAAQVTNLIGLRVENSGSLTNPTFYTASFVGAVSTFTATSLTASDDLTFAYMGGSGNRLIYVDNSGLASLHPAISSNAFLYIGPDNLIKTGIFGANLTFVPTTGTLNASGGGTNISGVTISENNTPFAFGVTNLDLISNQGHIGYTFTWVDGQDVTITATIRTDVPIVLQSLKVSNAITNQGTLLVTSNTFLSSVTITNTMTNNGTMHATGLRSNASANIPLYWDPIGNEIVKGAADYNLIFGNGTMGVTNGTNITLELSLQVSNALWSATNMTTIANVTNSTSGDVTNTINLAGNIKGFVLETNATSRWTNYSGYVAGTASDFAYYLMTGPGAITATFNTGAVHGLYWGRNSNNVVDASMTLAASSRYLYSGSRWGSNILQSLIKVNH